MAHSEFTQVQRPWDETPTHLHSTNQVWVSQYPATQDRAEYWQAYRAVAKAPAGRAPWTVDNRRIGTDRGFPTLDAALVAAAGSVS